MKKRTKKERGKPPDALQIFLHLLSSRRPEKKPMLNPSSLISNPSPEETVPTIVELLDTVLTVQLLQEVREKILEVLQERTELRRQVETLKRVIAMRDAGLG